MARRRSNLGRHTRQAEAKRRSIANQTEEERASAKERQRQRTAQKRAEETVERRAARLEAARLRARRPRSAASNRNRLRVAERRQRETADHRQTQLRGQQWRRSRNYRRTFPENLLSTEGRKGGQENGISLHRIIPLREDRKMPPEAEKVYKCSFCGKSFGDSLDLVAHERVHIGERIYKCQDCKKPFSHWIDLLTHKKNHQGEKPHRCDSDCVKCFQQRAFLKVHQRAHSGEKACQCSVCGESFIRMSNLIKHWRTHHCTECGKSTLQCRFSWCKSWQKR